MILIYIILATAISGIFSIAIAATLSLTILSKIINRMISLSAGVLLSTALLHNLPEAFTRTNIDISSLFISLLIGLLGFFLLEKIAVFRHSHHYEQDGHCHHHGYDKELTGRTGWIILLGDGLHNFSDGVLISAAFLTNIHMGILTTIAVTLHEIPQEIGDCVILLNAGFSKIRVLLYNFITALMAILGGIVGFFFLDQTMSITTHVIILSSSSFIYIAVSDLMPQMHQKSKIKESLEQILLIGIGVGIVLIGMHLDH